MIVIMSARESEFNFTTNKFNSFYQFTHFLTGVVSNEIAFVTHQFLLNFLSTVIAKVTTTQLYAPIVKNHNANHNTLQQHITRSISQNRSHY